jgi:phosphoglycerate kinase
MAFNKQTVRDIDIEGKRVLVRCDFNVPLKDGEITDDRRIKEAIPTIEFLLDHGASVVLCSHLGRPKGVTPEFSLAPVAKRLSEILEQEVPLLPDCIGPEVEAKCKALGYHEALLLENVRFHPEEEANNPLFAKSLAGLAEIYCNDAFGTAHRAHASTEGVAHVLPGVAGFLIEKEIHYLGSAVDNPKRPFVAILGGAKVKDKISVIDSLLPRVDRLIIGGGMAFTFLKAKGYEIGKSLFDESHFEYAKTVLADHADKVVLPVDVVATPELSETAPTAVVGVDALPADQLGADIGPQSIEFFRQVILEAGTVVWNGPMGVFEMTPFQAGTKGVAQALADSSCVSIVGGGDSAAAIEEFGFADDVTHVSTGGGASLEFLEGKELPGIAALRDR